MRVTVSCGISLSISAEDFVSYDDTFLYPSPIDVKCQAKISAHLRQTYSVV